MFKALFRLLTKFTGHILPIVTTVIELFDLQELKRDPANFKHIISQEIAQIKQYLHAKFGDGKVKITVHTVRTFFACIKLILDRYGSLNEFYTQLINTKGTLGEQNIDEKYK